jgi:RimJ/RimL family protein N-acetyltransferase
MTGSVCRMRISHRDPGLDLVVRPAMAADVEEIVDLYVRVGEEGLFVAAEPPIDRHERRLWLQYRIDAPWTLVLVATTGAESIGYLTAVGSEREPSMIGLGVAKAWRNRGVGTELVKAAIRWAQAHSVHKLVAEVFPHNEPTLHLFEKLEFRREGLLGSHYRRRSGALWDVVVLGLQLQHHSTSFQA